MSLAEWDLIQLLPCSFSALSVPWIQAVDVLAVHVAEQPKDDDKDQNGRDTAAAKFPRCCSRQKSTYWSFHFRFSWAGWFRPIVIDFSTAG